MIVLCVSIICSAGANVGEDLSKDDEIIEIFLGGASDYDDEMAESGLFDQVEERNQCALEVREKPHSSIREAAISREDIALVPYLCVWGCIILAIYLWRRRVRQARDKLAEKSLESPADAAAENHGEAPVPAGEHDKVAAGESVQSPIAEKHVLEATEESSSFPLDIAEMLGVSAGNFFGLRNSGKLSNQSARALTTDKLCEVMGRRYAPEHAKRFCDAVMAEYNRFNQSS